MSKKLIKEVDKHHFKGHNNKYGKKYSFGRSFVGNWRGKQTKLCYVYWN